MELKDRPILFSGAMIRALLDGRKTQTRRVIKPQPDDTHEGKPYWFVGGFRTSWIGRTSKEPHWGNNPLFCPYGRVGDRLWVREAWAVVPQVTDDGPRHRAKGDGTGITWRADWDGNPSGFKWKPSIHMPRWASRIALEIADVRVERLQDISPEDVAAEGVYFDEPELTVQFGIEAEARYCMSKLWEDINGPGSWAANPFVWVVDFHRI